MGKNGDGDGSAWKFLSKDYICAWTIISERVLLWFTSISQVRRLSSYIKMVLAGSRSLGVDLSGGFHNRSSDSHNSRVALSIIELLSIMRII